MINPDEPQPQVTPGTQLMQEFTGDGQGFAEREKAKKLVRIGYLPEGRFPWQTILIIFLSVVATTMAHLQPEPSYRLLYAGGMEIWLNRMWWGLLGCVFIHADVIHILFNCYWIWIFGRLLESKLGPLRYLGIFISASLIGSIAELGWSGQPGIGLSGVAYAFFGYLLVNRSRCPDYTSVLPMGTILLYSGWLVACFVLTYAKIYPVANFGHVGGLAIGCIVGFISYKHAGRKYAQLSAVAIGLGAVTVLLWAPWQVPWQMAHAYRALVANDDDGALKSLEKIRVQEPANPWAVLQEIQLRQKRGEYDLMRDILTQAAVNSTDAAILNNLAWLLATCPLPEIRNGAKAVQIGEHACVLDQWKNAASIDTLAAAYAEVGDFQAAETWSKKAVALSGEHSATLQEHLVSFQAKKPWREQSASEQSTTAK